METFKSDELLDKLEASLDEYISKYDELKGATRNRRERPQCINIISELERFRASLEKYRIAKEV